MPTDCGLEHGPYVPPVTIVGTYVECLVRGRVKVAGVSAGRVAWPIGERGGKRELVVFKGLAAALRQEDAAAVAAWWKVPMVKVKGWQATVQKQPARSGRHTTIRD